MEFPIISNLMRRGSKQDKGETRSFYPTDLSFPTVSNLTVSEKNPVVASCVSKITTTISSLTFHVHVHTKSGVQEAWNHPLAKVFLNPNPEETPAVFFSTVARQLLVHANCYLKTIKSGDEIVALKIIDASKVRVNRDSSGRKYFTIISKGITLTEDEVIHLINPMAGYNGTIGIAATKEFSDLIHKNDVIRSFIQVAFEGGSADKFLITLDKDKYDPLQDKQFEKLYEKFVDFMNKFVAGKTGPNTNNPLVTPPGTNISTISMPRNAELQARELLADSNKEIYNMFHIPSELMTDDVKGVYNTLNSRMTDYINSAVRPICDIIIQSFAKLLIGTPYFIEVDYKVLTETNQTEKVNNVVTLLNNGLISINEARKELHMDAIEGGDRFILPLNKGAISNISEAESNNSAVEEVK